MNHDENKPDVQAWIEPELEARIVAWVAGEASAFESAELERLIGEKPELAIFKRRIEAVHGLVAVAVRPDREPLRLSPERRAKLLRTLIEGDGPAEAGAPKRADAPVVFPMYGAKQQRRKRWRRFGTIAAGLMLGIFFSTLIKYSGENYERAPMSSVQYERRQPIEAADDEEKRSNEQGPTDPEQRQRSERQTAASMQRAKRGEELLVRDLAVETDNIPSAPPSIERRRAPSPTRVDQSRASIIQNQPTSSVVELKDSAGSINTGSPAAFSGARDLKFHGSDGPAESLGPRPGLPREMAKSQRWGLDPGNFGEDKLEKEVGGGLAASGFAQTAATADYYLSTVSDPVAGTKNRDSLYEASVSSTLNATQVNTPRGSNPILFGIGSPAGMMYTSSDGKKAEGFPAEQKQVSEVSSADEENSSTLNAAAPPDPEPAKIEALVVVTSEQPTEVNAAKQPVSTFSLHVSDVSFRLAQAALARGELPEPDRIRPEEFYNAFDYGDPAPAMAEKVFCRVEQSAHPMVQQRNLVRIAMKVPSVGRGAAQPLYLTVMLDTSGSMEREDRAPAVQQAMNALASLLGPNDRLTVIGFARQPRLLVDQLPGDKAKEALTAIAHTPSEGGTDLEAALKLASELALRNQVKGAQNRIVLLTDGAANLGNADPAQLASSVEALRQKGIAFDACGVGLDGMDDAMLERLTRKGDGRYYVLNTPEAADQGFARQLAGAFRPAAENVKVQVRFNQARVGAYRLIGFEQHRLKEEDFRNDKVDAAELAADEAAVAVYQVETLPQGEGDLGEVYVRFRDASNGNMIERSWNLPYDPQAAAFDRATPAMQLAGVATLLAEKIRGGAVADTIKLDELAPVINALRGHYRQNPRVQELVTMYEQLRRLKAE